jgi:hypothetical protein
VFDGGTDAVVDVDVEVVPGATARAEATTGVWGDVAAADPFLLLATTVTRRVFPTSAATTR